MSDILKAAKEALEGVTAFDWHPESAAQQGIRAIDALIARAEQAEAEAAALRDEVAQHRAGQTYRYIGKDGKPVLARDLEDERDALREEVARLREALAFATKPRPTRTPVPWQSYGGASLAHGHDDAKAWLTAEPLGHGVTTEDMAEAIAALIGQEGA